MTVSPCGDGEDEITSRSWVILGIQGKGMKSNPEWELS